MGKHWIICFTSQLDKKKKSTVFMWKVKEVEGETNRRDLVIIKMSSRLGPTEQEGYVLITRIVNGILDGSG